LRHLYGLCYEVYFSDTTYQKAVALTIKLVAVFVLSRLMPYIDEIDVIYRKYSYYRNMCTKEGFFKSHGKGMNMKEVAF
jgi:hypothetical protein